MAICIFFRLNHFLQKLFFLLMWQLEYFQKAAVWDIDTVRVWNCTGRYYTKYIGLPNEFQILSWLTQAKNHGSKPHQFLSCKNYWNFKRAWEDMSTRFLIWIWWFCITKRFLTIPFDKNTKISTYSWDFWSHKGFQDQILVLIAPCALHEKLKISTMLVESINIFLIKKIYGQLAQWIAIALQSVRYFTPFYQSSGAFLRNWIWKNFCKATFSLPEIIRLWKSTSWY